MKTIIVSVTNDLVTDQRVHKVCTTLQEMGFSIHLVGRKLKQSLPLQRSYKTTRMKLLFTKGPLFYAEYNLRLFMLLLFAKKNVLLANDLDTLFPNFLVSRLTNKPIVYDSHELFTEVPELINRPKVQKIWLTIEQFIFPKLKDVFTVNSLIATIYKDRYSVSVKILRNIAPMFRFSEIDKVFVEKVKGTSKMIILQGAGINVDRGGEEAVEMMRYLDNVVLYVIGSGDVFPILKDLVKKYKLENKVFLLGRRPYDELMQYTKIADLGLSLDKNTNLNYEYSLPNKVFDYIQAETPLLVSNRRVVAKLVVDENIGKVIDYHSPKMMADKVQEMLFSDEYLTWKANLKTAAQKYNWEKESKVIKEVYSKFL
ncbi:glycosyltransferase involved in cell wall biosynthesis [Wenyingzhuangia heitensis]|uniref:Glycosyltransferase involved in cell wall biosynthesis n=1 Tax=Wenyingzhuangia heitensis TaxID=1487859 RepID=A0ABX0U9C0_9FLAO|nr:glycosyltransferase [Wenyingzhuangia heitensis]NIJ44096.1 glycosyltransferase involved in cell wall biosynthesis [Wenyingzhuangia heitensis]